MQVVRQAQADATPVAAAGPRPSHKGSSSNLQRRTSAAAQASLTPTPSPSPLTSLIQRAVSAPLAKQDLKQMLLAGVTQDEFNTIITEFSTNGLLHNASLMRHLFASCLKDNYMLDFGSRSKTQLTMFFNLLNDSTLVSCPKFNSLILQASVAFPNQISDSLIKSPLKENQGFIKAMSSLAKGDTNIATHLRRQKIITTLHDKVELNLGLNTKEDGYLGEGMYGIVMRSIKTSYAISLVDVEDKTCRLSVKTTRVSTVAKKIFRCKQIILNNNELLQYHLQGPHFVKLEKPKPQDFRITEKRKILQELHMQYFDGMPIESFLRKGNISSEDKHHLISKMLTGLISMHNQRVSHGDLHQGNILIKRTDKNFEVKFIDFGSATDLSKATPSTREKVMRDDLIGFLNQIVVLLLPRGDGDEYSSMRTDVIKTYNDAMGTNFY